FETYGCCVEDTTWIIMTTTISAMAWDIQNGIPTPDGLVKECRATRISYLMNRPRPKNQQQLISDGEPHREHRGKKTMVPRRQQVDRKTHCLISQQPRDRSDALLRPGISSEQSDRKRELAFLGACFPEALPLLF